MKKTELRLFVILSYHGQMRFSFDKVFNGSFFRSYEPTALRLANLTILIVKVIFMIKFLKHDCQI